MAQRTIDKNPCAYCLEKAVDLIDNTIYLIEDQKYLDKSDFIIALENLKFRRIIMKKFKEYIEQNSMNSDQSSSDPAWYYRGGHTAHDERWKKMAQKTMVASHGYVKQLKNQYKDNKELVEDLDKLLQYLEVRLRLLHKISSTPLFKDTK